MTAEQERIYRLRKRWELAYAHEENARESFKAAERNLHEKQGATRTAHNAYLAALEQAAATVRKP